MLLLAFLSSIGVRDFGLKLFRILDDGDTALEFLENWTDTEGDKLLNEVRICFNISAIEIVSWDCRKSKNLQVSGCSDRSPVTKKSEPSLDGFMRKKCSWTHYGTRRMSLDKDDDDCRAVGDASKTYIDISGARVTMRRTRKCCTNLIKCRSNLYSYSIIQNNLFFVCHLIFVWCLVVVYRCRRQHQLPFFVLSSALRLLRYFRFVFISYLFNSFDVNLQ